MSVAKRSSSVGKPRCLHRRDTTQYQYYTIRLHTTDLLSLPCCLLPSASVHVYDVCLCMRSLWMDVYGRSAMVLDKTQA